MAQKYNCKISGIVVLYNPDKSVYKNIDSYIDFVDKLYILDNSETPCFDKSFFSQNKIQYLPFNVNLGVGYALKKGMSLSINDGYDYTLTMDQDTMFENIDNDEIKKVLSRDDLKDVAIFAFDTENKYKGIVSYINKAITSGNIIRNNLYSELKGFQEELFIDYVDFDLCEQVVSAGYKIISVPYGKLIHTIGSPKSVRFAFIKINSFNHNPIRYYYRYRNCFWLYRRNKSYYFRFYIKEIINLLKMLLCDDRRVEKIKMIILAYKDAKENKLGKFE